MKKKRVLSDEEKVISTITEFKEQMHGKQKNLIYAAVASLSLLLLAAGVFIYINTNKTKASEYEAEGYRYFYSFQGENAQWAYTKALESFKKAYDTKKSAYALFYIANCYEKLGRIDEALKSLNELADSFSDTATLSLAYNKMAAIYINKGEPQKAIEALDKLTKTKGAPMQDLAFIQGAAILESMGKPEEAKAKYKDLVDRFPNSLFASIARAKADGAVKP